NVIQGASEGVFPICPSRHFSLTKLELTSLSLSLSLLLIREQNEIGMLFSNAFLRILESSNSTYHHKIAVVEVLHKICKDPQTLVDLFVNYDCALESLNI